MTKFIHSLANSSFASKPLECILGITVAFVVLRMEITRNVTRRPSQNGDKPTFFGLCMTILTHSAVEVIGVVACVSLAVSFRLDGSFSSMSMVDEKGEVNEHAQAAAAAIAEQWPVLLTADTLLALQAMLRVLVLTSSLIRSRSGEGLISQEAALISCGAALGRVALLARSQAYLLDGPLGGRLPMVCEVLSALLLVGLCRNVHRRALLTSSCTVLVAACIGFRNHLALSSGDKITDGLFTFAHAAELLAAFAYLSRTVVLDMETEVTSSGRVALRFAHLLMPVQACFAAYYFVQAFDVVPELVGAGNPFQLLQWGCIAQVGAYTGAAMLHWAESLESIAETSSRSLNQATSNTDNIPRLARATVL